MMQLYDEFTKPIRNCNDTGADVHNNLLVLISGSWIEAPQHKILPSLGRPECTKTKCGQSEHRL